jgi:O-antigen ligase
LLDTAEQTAAHDGARAPSVGSRLFTVLLALVVICASVVSGLSADSGDKKMIVLPLAAVAGIALAILACTRFAGFVLLLLGIRSSIDALALSASSTSTTASTASDRGINPSSLLGVLFLLASLLWLAGQYFAGTQLRMSSVSKWLIAFWLAGVVSLMGSHHLQAGLTESLRIMAVVMMFIVLEQLIRSRQTMFQVLAASFASLLIPLGYTLYGFLLGHPASEQKSGLTRIIGTFAQSNSYARYLTFMIIFGMAIYPFVQGRLRTTLRLLLACSVVFLLLTLTLTSILAGMVGLFIIGIARRQALIFGLVAIAAVALIAVPGLSSRVNTVQTQPTATGQAQGNTLAWRFSYWAEVLPLANSNPVTGIGVGATSLTTDAAKQPHNDFLRAYVETGLIGLFVYTGMLGSLLVACRRAVRISVRGTLNHAIAVGALACVVCVIIESIASNVITNSVALWYLMSFVAAAQYVYRSSSMDANDPLPRSSVAATV